MKSSSGYFIVVIEDVALEKVVGAATLLVEKKFIHECGQVVIILCMHLFKYVGRTYSGVWNGFKSSIGCSVLPY